MTAPVPPGSGKNDKLSATHPEVKQGRGNSHTVISPAFIQRQLVPPSGEAMLGQNKTGYTFGHAKSASAPLPPQTERG